MQSYHWCCQNALENRNVFAWCQHDDKVGDRQASLGRAFHKLGKELVLKRPIFLLPPFGPLTKVACREGPQMMKSGSRKD